MRISRPCYDKYRRCPGWAGGGPRSARTHRCDNGFIQVNYDDRWRDWKMWPCSKCDVWVLPYNLICLSPTRIRWTVTRWFRDKIYDLGLWWDEHAWRDESDKIAPWYNQIGWQVQYLLCRWSGTEWSENWRVWPHCNTQNGCWMHIDRENGPHCNCACKWCRMARRIRH